MISKLKEMFQKVKDFFKDKDDRKLVMIVGGCVVLFLLFLLVV